VGQSVPPLAGGAVRLGPVRLVGGGLASVAEVRRAARLCFVLALAGGLLLTWWNGGVILLIGLASLLAGWLYSAGSRPLSHTPWGESCVLLFFGLVAVAGSCFLQTGRFSALALAFAPVMVGSFLMLQSTGVDPASMGAMAALDNGGSLGASLVWLGWLIAIPVAMAVSVWFLYRMIKGLLLANEKQPV